MMPLLYQPELGGAGVLSSGALDIRVKLIVA